MEGITATQAAAALVADFTPFLRTVRRLQHYRQPACTWRLAPTCDPKFAAHLKDTWKRLDLLDRTQFTEEQALLLGAFKMHGLDKLHERGPAYPAHGAPAGWHTGHLLGLASGLTTIVGDALLALMTPAARAQWFPWHGYEVVIGRDGRSFTLRADSLQVVPSAIGQPLYVAPQRPPLVGHGARRPVGFTAHAIERWQDRREPRHTVDSSTSLWDCFAALAYVVYMEPAELYGHRPAVALFDRATPGFFVHNYVTELLGPQPPGKQYLYRLGYGPLEREGDVWCVKTLLVPGYAGTPEYGVLLRASLALGVKEKMQKACEEQLTTTQLMATRDFSLVRWFHTHGIPQVIPEPAGAYRVPTGQ